MKPEIVVHADRDQLAEAIAARLATRIADVQAAGRVASLVLTGGGVGTSTLAALAKSPARDAIDWSRVDFWWGDERFLPVGDPERNETGARSALLDHVKVSPARVHAMPASDGPAGGNPELAAERYAADLAAAAGPTNGDVPAFDVLLLGVGPDGHVASLFPEKPALYEEDRTVVAVHGSPKPPPTRISLTLPAINSAREVWLCVGGDDKASAVRLALSGAGPIQIPAAGVRGQDRTLWLLDRAAAKELPPDLRSPVLS
jgi:6-phosphogluconolactonase